MKIIHFSLFVLMSVLPVAQASEIPDHPAQKITAHTYVIHGPLGLPSKQNRGFMNNPGFVITRTGVVVIDPGSSVQVGRMLVRQIKKITDKPVTHVFDTHVHGDHWLGNQAITEQWPKAILMGHPNMIRQARNGAADRWVRLMDSMTASASKGTVAVIPDRAVEHADLFEIGGLKFRIHSIPKAHSNTDIMIEVVDDSVLFLGDNVLYERIGRMDDATFRGNMQACDMALKTGVKHYVPGHGKSGDKSRVEAYRRYLQILYREVGKYYEEGLADFEMKPMIVVSLKDYQGWNGFEDEVGRHISLALLEIEQAEFE